MKIEDIANGGTRNVSVADSIIATENILITKEIRDKSMADAYWAFSKKTKGWRNIVAEWVLSFAPDEIMSSIGAVKINRAKLRGAMSHGYGPLKFFSLVHLEKMIKDGVHYSSNKKKRANYHNLAHRFSFEGENYIARISIQEDQNGRLFYDHQFTELKKVDAPATGREGSSTTSPHQPSLDDLIIAMRDIFNNKGS